MLYFPHHKYSEARISYALDKTAAKITVSKHSKCNYFKELRNGVNLCEGTCAQASWKFRAFLCQIKKKKKIWEDKVSKYGCF